MASQNRTHASDRGKAIPDLPGVPTIGTATAGAGLATVAFTASAVGGLSTSYTALSSPGSITGTGTSSPITVSSLTPGTAYTFTVRGVNTTGNGDYSSASNSVTPTAVNAYESIATVVPSGSTNTVTFSSIPSTYKHLQLRLLQKDNYVSPLNASNVRFNSDPNANYAYHRLIGDGSSVSADSGASQTGMSLDLYASNNNSSYGVAIIDILDYASTNKYKTVRSFCGYDANGSGRIQLNSALWMNQTDAITSISFAIGGSIVWNANSSFALYGIKGA